MEAYFIMYGFQGRFILSLQVWLFVTLWTVAHQAPLSTGFSRQEYWSGLPFPLPGIFSTQWLNPCLLHYCVGRKILYHWATWEVPNKGMLEGDFLRIMCEKFFNQMETKLKKKKTQCIFYLWNYYCITLWLNITFFHLI